MIEDVGVANQVRKEKMVAGTAALKAKGETLEPGSPHSAGCTAEDVGVANQVRKEKMLAGTAA